MVIEPTVAEKSSICDGDGGVHGISIPQYRPVFTSLDYIVPGFHVEEPNDGQESSVRSSFHVVA